MLAAAPPPSAAHATTIPALVRGTPLVLYTRQIPTTTGAPAEAAAANPATGETTAVGPAGGIGAPAVAQPGAGLVVAWAARGGGVAVSALP